MTQIIKPSPINLRVDIQVLRALAILPVLFFHAKLEAFPAGYLGVDVFFVISGYLITTLIRKAIARNDFSLTRFYFRRAKRILPAAYVVFILTACIAPYFLSSGEVDNFIRQLTGAVTFTANMALWRQAGYFDGASELKPLLHAWSLSIEEQYYLFVPALMLFLPKRQWLKMVVIAFLISIALSIIFVGSTSAVFFLFPSRAWELMIGSFGALIVPNLYWRRYLKILFWPALFLVVGLPLVGLKTSQYDFGPFAACWATLVVILSEHSFLTKGPIVRVLGWFGDISYSLYLVHWPIFAFFYNAWISGGEFEWRAWRTLLIIISIALGYLLSRFVEKPIHYAEVDKARAFVVKLLLSSVGIILFGFLLGKANIPAKDYVFLQRSNVGLGGDCLFTADMTTSVQCRNSDSPKYLLWGDSYAMHLAPALIDSVGATPSFTQYTRPVCGPFPGVAVIDNLRNRKWAEQCIKFNDSIFEYLKNTPSIDTVIMSSHFVYLFAQNKILYRDGAGSFSIEDNTTDQLIDNLKVTVEKIRALGRKVVLIAPPPSDGFDIGRCLERSDRNMSVISDKSNCQVSHAKYQIARASVLGLLDELPERAKLNVISFDEYLCDKHNCKTKLDGTFLYRDDGHFSVSGSRLISERMQLLNRIDKTAN